MTETLTETERLTFGALLRTLIRLDGYTTPDEQAVVHNVARDLLSVEPGADVADALAALLERSAESYRDDESVRAAAEAVTRPEARDAIYGALYEISSSGTITSVESQLLDWLAERWSIRIREVDAPAG
jgi:uncharacterized tellurite resistance protein B-like protein